MAARAEEVLIIINILGLATFVVAALTMGKFNTSNFEPFFPKEMTGLFTAANIAFFAYSGFNTIATLTPDVQDGERSVPRAIVFSLVISTVLYELVVFSMLFALYWSSYGSVANPLSVALSSIGAPTPVSLIVAFSATTATITVTLSLIIAGSRTTKQMGEDGLLPKILGKGSWIPTIVVAGIMIASLGLGTVESIALVANFGVIFSYLLSGLEVIVTRRKGAKGSFYSPAYPIVQIFSLALSTIMLITLGIQSLMVGTATLVTGLIVHSIHNELIKQNKTKTKS
jgi:APA family basic amino acid/polyamine antiporter